MKRGNGPKRRTRLAQGKPLERTPFRTRGAQLARTAAKRKPKTTAGEFLTASRRAMWNRFNGRCIVCGLMLPWVGWTAQHRRARGAGGSTAADTPSPANGLAVHEVPCHRWIENNPTAALPLGLRIKQGTDPAAEPVTLWDRRVVYLDHDGGWSTTRPDTTEERTAA